MSPKNNTVTTAMNASKAANPYLEYNNDVRYFCFLWHLMRRMLDECRQSHRRFCLRHIICLRFGSNAMTDILIRRACGISHLGGYEEIPSAVLYPRKQREAIRAIACIELEVSERMVNLQLIDKAYSIVYPNSTPLNVNKQKRDCNKK